MNTVIVCVLAAGDLRRWTGGWRVRPVRELATRRRRTFGFLSFLVYRLTVRRLLFAIFSLGISGAKKTPAVICRKMIDFWAIFYTFDGKTKF